VNSALVFVCTPTLGPYLNALSYLDDKRSVTRFTLVAMTGEGIEAPAGLDQRIVGALEGLAEGKFESRENDRTVERLIDIQRADRERYARIANSLRKHSPTVRNEHVDTLAAFIAEHMSTNAQNEVVIDVTGLTKVQTARIILICLDRGNKVHTFDLDQRASKDHPERSLYHLLEPGSYRYECLTRDQAVQTSLKKFVSRSTITWSTAAVIGVAIACLGALQFVQPTNPTLSAISLVANVLGIAGVLWQGTTRRGP